MSQCKDTVPMGGKSKKADNGWHIQAGKMLHDNSKCKQICCMTGYAKDRVITEKVKDGKRDGRTSFL